MVSSNMWTETTGCDGTTFFLPNHGQQQLNKEVSQKESTHAGTFACAHTAREADMKVVQTGKWTSDMLGRSLPQTPELRRTKALSPWKLNGPFPGEGGHALAMHGGRPLSSRLQTAMSCVSLSPSRPASRVSTAASRARTAGGQERPAPSRQSSRSSTAPGVRATFQVRFPGDDTIFVFKTWEEVSTAFAKRGFNPKQANVHTRQGAPSRTRAVAPGATSARRQSSMETSYAEMSKALNTLASRGQNPYRQAHEEKRQPGRIGNVVRSPVRVWGGGMPMV